MRACIRWFRVAPPPATICSASGAKKLRTGSTERRLRVSHRFVRLTDRHLRVPHRFARLTERHLRVPHRFVTLTKRRLRVPHRFARLTKRHLRVPHRFVTLTEHRLKVPHRFARLTKHRLRVPHRFARLTKRHLRVPHRFVRLTKHRLRVPHRFARLTEHRLRVPHRFVRLTKRHLTPPRPVAAAAERHFPLKTADSGEPPTFATATGRAAPEEILAFMAVGGREGRGPGERIRPPKNAAPGNFCWKISHPHPPAPLSGRKRASQLSPERVIYRHLCRR
jgi:hypothetical protein